jgi:hypothetical protein
MKKMKTVTNSKKVTKKPTIKKAQNGTMEGYELPEFTKTASRIVDKPKTSSKTGFNYRKMAKGFNKANKPSIKSGGMGKKKLSIK